MKRKNVIASVAGIVLSVITVFTSVGAVKAEEGTVTEKQAIEMAVENEIGEKKIADEDAKVINEAFGYTSGSNIVKVCSEDTWAYIDWEKSLYKKEDVYETNVFCPVLSRDEDGNLVVEKDENGEIKIKKFGRGFVDWRGKYGAIGNEGSCFSIDGSPNDNNDIYYNMVDDTSYCSIINRHMGRTSYIGNDDNGKWGQIPITDVYIVRVQYTTDGKGNYWENAMSGKDEGERNFGAMSFWFLPEGVSTVLKLEDVNEPDDNKPTDTYTLDLSSDNAVVSSETFNTLLEENKTKDVVIKSNNDVTFTFAKGTMKPVEGKDSYDFSTIINSAYNTDLPSYVTSNNFVSQINYNYSGKLPAEASIRFYAGTQYSGKTLYYYLLNEDKTFAEVQSIVVDDLGYVTVRQDHCSSYLLTSEEPKIQDNTNNTETSGTTEDKTSPVTGDNTSNKETPATGDNSMMLLYLLAGMSAMGMIVELGKRRKTA